MLASALAFVILALLFVVQPTAPASAQGPIPTGASAAGTGDTSIVGLIGFALALIVIIGAAVKLYDRKRTREAEAVHLQAQLSDALLRESRFSGLPVTVTVRTATFRRSAPIIEIAGQVPMREAHERVLNFVRTETVRLQPDAQFEDRIAIVPSMATRAG